DDFIMHGRHLTDMYLNFVLLRLEFPRQSGRHVGIKADSERTADDTIGRFFRNLSGAAEAGRLAVPIVKRDGSVGRTDDTDGHGPTASRHQQIAAQWFLVSMVTGLGH